MHRFALSLRSKYTRAIELTTVVLDFGILQKSGIQNRMTGQLNFSHDVSHVSYIERSVDWSYPDLKYFLSSWCFPTSILDQNT